MLRRCAIIVALCVSASPALAGPASSSFEVAPTTVDLSPGRPGLFYIANRGGNAVNIQIQTMDWHQAGDADSLTPSDTLYASPPLVTVEPGERQVVRLLADPADITRESEYRLIVSQLPQGETQGAAVQMLLQFSVPVFVTSAPASKPDVVWSAVQDGHNMQITVRNDGAAAVKLTGMQLRAPGDARVPVTDGLAYVLPGATRSWRIAFAGAGSEFHLTAKDERSGAILDTNIVPLR